MIRSPAIVASLSFAMMFTSAPAAIADSSMAPHRANSGAYQPVGSWRPVTIRPDGTLSTRRTDAATISPSGRYVAFYAQVSLDADHPAKGWHLYLRDRHTGTTTMVDLRPNGTVADEFHDYARIEVTDDAQVLFASDVDGLVNRDHNRERDIFMRDTQSGVTTLISANVDGYAANGRSEHATLTADGSEVIFESWASDLVVGDTNGYPDIFARELHTGTTMLLSRTIDGEPADGYSGYARPDASGRLVAFQTWADNLVNGGHPTHSNVVLLDRATGEYALVSRGRHGRTPTGQSIAPEISGDGSTVVFHSRARNLVRTDPTPREDLFRYDVATGKITAVTPHTWIPGYAKDAGPAYITHDGRTIVYSTKSDAILPDDTNGYSDVFTFDVATRETRLVSMTHRGDPGNHYTLLDGVTPDGRYLIVSSRAGNLLERDAPPLHAAIALVGRMK
jgi:Tol biopolymer transport system component